VSLQIIEACRIKNVGTTSSSSMCGEQSEKFFVSIIFIYSIVLLLLLDLLDYSIIVSEWWYHTRE